MGINFSDTDDLIWAGREMGSLFLGEPLGYGIARNVFSFRRDPKLVIKIENSATSFQNVIEWEMWQCLAGTEAGKWLAPCHDISGNGGMLIQSRVEPLQRRQLPKKMPSFLCDFKKENYGLLNGKVVCCDYGLLARVVNGKVKMRKSNWFSVKA